MGLGLKPVLSKKPLAHVAIEYMKCGQSGLRWVLSINCTPDSEDSDWKKKVILYVEMMF